MLARNPGALCACVSYRPALAPSPLLASIKLYIAYFTFILYIKVVWARQAGNRNVCLNDLQTPYFGIAPAERPAAQCALVPVLRGLLRRVAALG